MASSFRTFLQGYCSELSGLDTASLKRFALTLPDVPRLKEPLLLLALEQGREAYLLRHCGSAAADYSSWIAGYRRSGLDLVSYLDTLPQDDRFHKVLQSWKSGNGQLEADRRLLAQVSRRFNELLAEKGLTRAQACRIAGLNKGNFYAFLKGDVTKLSRSTAIAAYDAIARA